MEHGQTSGGQPLEEKWVLPHPTPTSTYLLWRTAFMYPYHNFMSSFCHLRYFFLFRVCEPFSDFLIQAVLTSLSQAFYDINISYFEL